MTAHPIVPIRDEYQVHYDSYDGARRNIAASSASSTHSPPSSSGSPPQQRGPPYKYAQTPPGEQRPPNPNLAKRPSLDAQEAGRGSGPDSEKRRQRIQQACKSCGAKRVKCDGQLPCNTCLRTGDQCEYGRPKKRGPPKGSTRAPPKRLVQQQQQHEPQRAQSQLPSQEQAAQLMGSSHGSSASRRSSSGSLFPQRSVQGTVAPFTFRSQEYGLQPASHHTPAAPLSVGDHRLSPGQLSHPLTTSLRHPRISSPPSTSFATMTVQQTLPSTRLPPHLPQSSFAFERHRGPYGVLPDPSVSAPSASWHSKFRGGSSGILDLPRLVRTDSSVSSGRRYWPDSETHLSRLSRGSSPASFALEPLISHSRTTTVASPLRHSQGDADSPKVPPLSGTPPPMVENLSAEAGPFIPSAPQDLAAEGVFMESPSDSNSSRPHPHRQLYHPRFPRHVEDTLFKIYWNVIFAHWPMLVKRLLPIIDGQARVEQQAEPLLYNALLSLSACVWDLQRDGPLPAVSFRDGDEPRVPSVDELSEIYFTRARFWLARTDNDSSIETAQALLCMSLRESGCGRSTQGAHYAMSACRVALDLGLHRQMPTTDASQDEIQTRLRLWWSIYNLDKLNSAQLGRPCVLRFVETDTPLPNIDHPDEIEIWTPYDSATAIPQSSISTRVISGLSSSAELTIILEEVIRQYNLVRPQASAAADDRLGSRGHLGPPAEPWDVAVMRLHNQLDVWHQSLPAHLKIQSDGPTLPHVLFQHMWACATRIILHRPHILRQATTQTNLPDSHLVCTQTALELCDLVALYRKDHGIKRLSGTISYCVFTAASILLANSTSPDGNIASEARLRLRECCEILAAIGGTWGNASVHLSILRRLGESIDADLTGTGLELRDSTKAGLAHLLHPDEEGSTVHRAYTEGTPGPLSQPLSRPQSSKQGDSLLTSVGTQASSSSATETDGGTDSHPPSGGNIADDIFTALQDENYWAKMPLSSENVEAWNLFTRSYLEDRQACDC